MSLRGISAIGKSRFKAYGAILFLDLLVLALSARVNIFQEFFFAADHAPLILSIITLVVIPAMVLIDVFSNDAPTARPAFELTWLGLLTLFWLCFNAFSSSRWRYISLSSCAAIPAGFEDEKQWCQTVVALQAFIWIEFVAFFITFITLLRTVYSYSLGGYYHIWATSLSRFDPDATTGFTTTESVYGGGLNELTGDRWEKFRQ